MLGEEAAELWRFLEALGNDPRDKTLRSVFADWLEDKGEDERAAAQRSFSVEKFDAEMRLRTFAIMYAGGDYDGMIKGLVSGEYCFSDDYGPELAREDDELWADLATVTGIDADELAVEREDGSFRCAC
jgi:uncharacterized protein (TIGR02996 family)